MIGAADAAGDGRVSYGEFKQLMRWQLSTEQESVIAPARHAGVDELLGPRWAALDHLQTTSASLLDDDQHIRLLDAKQVGRLHPALARIILIILCADAEEPGRRCPRRLGRFVAPASPPAERGLH